MEGSSRQIEPASWAGVSPEHIGMASAKAERLAEHADQGGPVTVGNTRCRRVRKFRACGVEPRT